MKYLNIIIVFALSIIILSSSVYAITGSLGNARMVLYAEVGDTIHKTILVKNVNNESINITAFASGDLEKDITLKDKSFILQPNSDKNVQFDLKVTKKGTFETKINIQFSSIEGKGAGVGLSSTIVLVASGQGETPVEDNNQNNVNDSQNKTQDNTSDNSTAQIQISPVLIAAGAFTILLIVLLIILLIISKKKRGVMGRKKR
jgi:hypothetical protein